MKKQTGIDPRPTTSNPEIKDPSKKEQEEVSREKKEIDTGTLKKNIEKPEIPHIPEEVPEVNPGQQNIPDGK